MKLENALTSSTATPSQVQNSGQRARVVSISLNRIGGVMRPHKDFRGALKNYQEGLEIARRPAEANRSSFELMRVVLTDMETRSVAEIFRARKAVRARFAEALSILKPLAERSPADHQLQQHLTRIESVISQTSCADSLRARKRPGGRSLAFIWSRTITRPASAQTGREEDAGPRTGFSRG
jgi:hypothetical protein